MSITQTVEIPVNHKLTIDVPPEVPTGRAKIIYFPATDTAYDASADDDELDSVGKCPICAANRDPVTGNPRYNAETIAGMQEVEDVVSGKIPAKWYNSLEEMLVDLDSDD